MNHDDDRDADIITLPTFNLAPPGADPDDDEVPGLPEPARARPRRPNSRCPSTSPRTRRTATSTTPTTTPGR